LEHRGALLASFGLRDQANEIISNIIKKANVPRHKIFIFKILNSIDDEYVFTYNLSPEHSNTEYSKIYLGTISVHRKKETNTLFTINAMNEVIKIKNRGHLNPHYNVKWEEFVDTLLVIKQGKLRILKLQLIKLNQ
jgi:hypothetical protein